MHADLAEVATFVRVVDAGSMHGAARALSVPRSTVSRRVARLEEQLGVRLLKRTTRRMSLTEEGQRFYDRVSPAVEAIRGASAEATDASSEPSGTLRVTAPTDFGPVLAGLAALFARRYPKVSLDLDPSNRVVDLVQEGFDIAIRAGALRDSTLVARRLTVVDLWLFASPTYLEERGVPQSPADLATHEAVLFRADRGVQPITLRRGDEVVPVELRGRLGSRDFSLLHSIVAAGGGIGALPAFLPLRDLEEGRIVRVLAPWSVPGAPLHIVTASGRYPPAKVSAFRDFLVEAMSPPPWEAVAAVPHGASRSRAKRAP